MTDAERIEVLALAYALLDGSRWFTMVDPASANGEAYCALTAYAEAWYLRSLRPYEPAAQEEYARLRLLIAHGIPGSPVGEDAIARYNDAPGRRKRDVLRLYEKAAAKIGKG